MRIIEQRHRIGAKRGSQSRNLPAIWNEGDSRCFCLCVKSQLLANLLGITPEITHTDVGTKCSSGQPQIIEIRHTRYKHIYSSISKHQDNCIFILYLYPQSMHN